MGLRYVRGNWHEINTRRPSAMLRQSHLVRKISSSRTGQTLFRDDLATTFGLTYLVIHPHATRQRVAKRIGHNRDSDQTTVTSDEISVPAICIGIKICNPRSTMRNILGIAKRRMTLALRNLLPRVTSFFTIIIYDNTPLWKESRRTYSTSEPQRTPLKAYASVSDR